MEPPAFRPRYWQAYAHIELGGLDANHYKTAENLLKDLALTPVTTGEPPELRQALSALGFVLQQQKKFTEAVSYYQKLLEQYPQDPNAVQVRFWMGESYLQAAQQEQEKLKQAGEKVQSDRFLKLKEAYLDKAVAQFGQVISTLVVLEHQRKLTAEEQELLRKGYFYQADCYSRQVGKADDAIRTYEGLVVLFGEKPEALLALAYLIECHARQDHRDQVQTTVLRARELLGKLKDNELQGTPRQTWEDWLHERARANAPQR
jgi:tetratricopeptide (TPR) repeat protein